MFWFNSVETKLSGIIVELSSLLYIDKIENFETALSIFSLIIIFYVNWDNTLLVSAIYGLMSKTRVFCSLVKTRLRLTLKGNLSGLIFPRAKILCHTQIDYFGLTAARKENYLNKMDNLLRICLNWYFISLAFHSLNLICMEVKRI